MLRVPHVLIGRSAYCCCRLVPTLLLLPEAELGSSDWQQQQRRGGRAVGILEAWLRMLAPLSQGTEDGAPGGRLPAVAAAMLHW